MEGLSEPLHNFPGCPFGSHRAGGELPQQAERVDAGSLIWRNELRIDVEMLNLDSSSMRQLEESCEGNVDGIRRRIQDIVRARGKMHNPVTGSGGMLIGRVSAIGPDFPDRTLRIGERLCTLVSLSLTPLVLDTIGDIDRAAAQVHVRGKAILFESGLYTRLPEDIPEPIAVSLFDVAGAPATVAKLARCNDSICVFGAGKAGTLCLFAAREILGKTGLLVAVEELAATADEVRRLGVADQVLHLDSRDAIATYQALHRASGGLMFDLTVNTTNTENTEGGSILATKPSGRLVLFSMSTSFTRAALTAEGVGRDIEMLIGNGFTKDWIETTLRIYRTHPELAAFMTHRHAQPEALTI